MREVCQQISHRHDLRIDLQADALPVDLRQDVSLCFYRVAQEALNNVVKHSNTSNAQVILTQDAGILRMMVKDFGSGFEIADAAAGLGLATMKERLHTIGGAFSVVSKPGEGTMISAEAPIPQCSPSR